MSASGLTAGIDNVTEGYTGRIVMGSHFIPPKKGGLTFPKTSNGGKGVRKLKGDKLSFYSFGTSATLVKDYFRVWTFCTYASHPDCWLCEDGFKVAGLLR
ncbi:hypothetical protein V1478_012858 [Vespula squamosa]|uniref:Uncharacterized protein n=1 Tax=Vespula squamosa TaxID=30214 RepID=A0ABD2A962_VESSQ